MGSVARNTLYGAQYFVANAIAAGGGDLTVFGYNVEAAIVFGRSVTFHLQKEFADCPDFPAWYTDWQTKLNADPICRYFLTKRNYVLKEGPAQLARSVTIFIDAGLTMHAELRHTRISVGPWCHRFYQWFLEILRRVRRSKEKKQIAAKAKSAIDRPAPTRAEVRVEFQDSPVPNRQAIDLLKYYLDMLDEVVTEAEGRWASS